MININVSDMTITHEHAFEWTFDPTPVARYIEHLDTMLGALDGRIAKTPQARWARELLRPERAHAQRYLAARAKAALAVEPSRESFRAALETACAAEAACDDAFASGEASKLVIARADRDMKGVALMNGRADFAEAIRAISDVRSECTLGECVRAWQRRDPSWDTVYLRAQAGVISRWQIGYHNNAYDSARRQGGEYSIEEMIGQVCQESEHAPNEDFVATCRVRWEMFAHKHNIAFEPAMAPAPVAAAE